MEASSTSNGPSAVDRVDAASLTRDSPGHTFSSAVRQPAIPVGERSSRQTPRGRSLTRTWLVAGDAHRSHLAMASPPVTLVAAERLTDNQAMPDRAEPFPAETLPENRAGHLTSDQ